MDDLRTVLTPTAEIDLFELDNHAAFCIRDLLRDLQKERDKRPREDPFDLQDPENGLIAMLQALIPIADGKMIADDTEGTETNTAAGSACTRFNIINDRYSVRRTTAGEKALKKTRKAVIRMYAAYAIGYQTGARNMRKYIQDYELDRAETEYYKDLAEQEEQADSGD